MDEIIQIKCPFDGVILSVKNQPGIETKNVTCPVCKNKYPFTKFKKVVKPAVKSDPETEYPDNNNTTADDNQTQTSVTELCETSTPVGFLRLMGTCTTFRLRSGRNVVGRKGARSTADIQIDTADKRNMSREHIVIDVKMVPGKGAVHYLSLAKEKVNRTLVEEEPLLFGDTIMLDHGDMIRLPDATLRFEIPGMENVTGPDKGPC